MASNNSKTSHNRARRGHASRAGDGKTGVGAGSAGATSAKATKSSNSPNLTLRLLNQELQRLDPNQPMYQAKRAEIIHNIRLAKSSMNRPQRAPVGRGNARPRRRAVPSQKSTQGGQSPSKTGNSAAKGLSKLLTPQAIQESLKTVGNLRSMVRNVTNYLQQADQMLDTLYVTSNSLKETGVLDKIIKNRGKNMTTEDFTNVLIALMSSPIGSQLFKSMGGDKSEDGAASSSTAAANGGNSTTAPAQAPGTGPMQGQGQGQWQGQSPGQGQQPGALPPGMQQPPNGQPGHPGDLY